MDKEIKKQSRSLIIIIIVVLIINNIIWAILFRNSKVNNNEETAEKISTLEIEPQRTKPEVISTNTWDTEKINIVNDTEGTPVPVPKGYVASSIEGEHTIDTGFVIYEGEDPVTEENKETAQKERNQWVWIPIYYPDEIYGRDANGAAHGKLYEFGYTGRTKLNWEIENGAMKISTGNVNEPIKDSLSSTYIPDYLSEEGKEYSKEFEEMIAGVEKYGGFYIGRYETGGLSTITKVVRGDNDIGDKTFNQMHEKSRQLKGTNENVETNMIWGCLWDATLEWLVDTGNKTYEEIGINSLSWGNYEKNTAEGHGKKQPTGYSEEWKANNIYDLAGNAMEVTMEGTWNINIVASARGHGASADSREFVSLRYAYNNLGCRAILYID